MNALVKKEIRLLLPSFSAVLLLETLLPWVYRDADAVFSMTPLAFFLGLVIVAVDSFGREFNLGTFQSLMAQPVERQKIWRTKIAILFIAVGVISLAYFASCGIRMEAATHAEGSIWTYNAKMIRADFFHAMLASVALLLVAVSGGLWTTLVLRQTTASFWVTFLFPALALLLLALLIPKALFERLSDNSIDTAIFSLLVLTIIYSVGGYWLACRFFSRAQDAGWSGGIIQFSRWRYFARATDIPSEQRQHRPFAALLKKELQLHSISLFCVGALVALHLGAFLVRSVYGSSQSDSVLHLFANGFWMFWLVVPAIIGCTAMAEERKLGVVDGQFCLPVSRRRQFLVKFVPALVLGTLLGGVVPLVLETTAAHLGIANDFFKADMYQNGSSLLNGYVVFLATIVLIAAGLVWLGFLASSLTKSFLQALSLTIAGCVLTLAVFAWLGVHVAPRTPLPYFIALPVIPATTLWMAWQNFNRFGEGWRVWRRNLTGIALAILFIAVSSVAIYERVWELAEPADPSHGAAKLLPPNTPKLTSAITGDIYLQWPDGRVWCDSLSFAGYYDYRSQWQYAWAVLCRPWPASDGPRQFVAGSNWVSLVTHHVDFLKGENNKTVRVQGYLDTVGIKRDGSLWISREAKPFAWTGADMTQVGTNQNWKQVASYPLRFCLLKADGTLWSWSRGTNRIDWNNWRSDWPTIRKYPIQQIDTDSDWQEIRYPYVRKNDGTTWQLTSKSNDQIATERATNWDQVTLKTFSNWGNGEAYISSNGALYFWQKDQANAQVRRSGFQQIGSETNWQNVAILHDWMVALKKDGTLWKWNIGSQNTAPIDQQTPVRLDRHADWIGICSTWSGIVSLAADGSLWVWPSADKYDFALTRPPRQPHRIGNVLPPEE